MVRINSKLAVFHTFGSVISQVKGGTCSLKPLPTNVALEIVDFFAFKMTSLGWI